MLGTLKHKTKFIVSGAITAVAAHEYIRGFTPLQNLQAKYLSLNNIDHTIEDSKMNMAGAIMRNSPSQVSELLHKNPARLNDIQDFGWLGAEGTNLDFALHHNSFDAAVELLKNGAKIEDLHVYQNPLKIAAENGHVGLLKATIAKKPSLLSEFDRNGNNVLLATIPTRTFGTPIFPEYFHLALKNVSVMKVLIDQGVDPHQKNIYGDSFYTSLDRAGLSMIRLVLQASEKVCMATPKLKPS